MVVDFFQLATRFSRHIDFRRPRFVIVSPKLAIVISEAMPSSRKELYRNANAGYDVGLCYFQSKSPKRLNLTVMEPANFCDKLQSTLLILKSVAVDPCICKTIDLHSQMSNSFCRKQALKGKSIIP